MQKAPAPQPWLTPFDRVATPEDVLACFRLILGRNPNPEEWTGHLGLVGQDLDLVVANYAGSAEFAARNLLQPPGAVRLVALPEYRIYAPVDDEAVGRHVAFGEYDPHVASILRRVLRPGMGMLDLGANIGVFALLGAALVGTTGRVLAVEPNPDNARLLEASRLANGFTQLTVVQAAAAREIGILALHNAGSNGTATRVHEQALLSARTVSALPVDLLVGQEQGIDLIKIDVEGAEYLALSGASSLLRRCRPVIVSEFSPSQLAKVSGIDGPGYLDYLRSHGYRHSVLEQDGTFEPGQTAAAVMQAYELSGVDHIDIVATPVET